MYRTLSLTTLLVFLSYFLPCARAGDDEDPLRPVPPVGQARIADFRNFGSGGSCALSPDGKTLAAAMHNSVMLYDLSSATQAGQGRSLAPVRNMYFMESAIAFSADGKLLAGIGAQHQEDQTVHFFDVKTGKEARQIDNDQHFFSLAFSADSKVLALGCQQHLELWDAVSGDEIRILQGEPNTVYRLLAFAPDGKMLATAGSDSTVQLWEIASGKERGRFTMQVDVPENRRYYGPGGQWTIGALAFARDGKLLAVGCADSTIRLWDVLTGQEQPPLCGHLGAVSALAFTADGKRLVSFDYDGLKLAWSVAAIERAPIANLPTLSDAAFEEAWTDLADADAFHIYRAVRYLASDAGRALPLLNRYLHPVPQGDAKRLAQLVTDLQSQKAGVRRKAMAALRNEGEAGFGALVQASEQGQANPNMPMNVKMARFRGGPVPGGGTIGSLMHKLEEQCASPERTRSIKAVQVLEQIDNEQAHALLHKLSKGAAGARLTVAANAALERLTARKKSDKADAGERAPSARELDTLWINLGGADSAAAFKAMRWLWANPGQGLAFLHDRLRPRPGPDASQIPQLIAALNNDRYAEREQAMKTLTSFGKLAEPALRESLSRSPSAESRRRIEQLLEKCDQAVPDAETLRCLRAIEVLEQIHVPQARQVLEKLTKGAPSSEAGREARAALERMDQRAVVAR